MIDASLGDEIKAHIIASFKDTEVIKAFSEHILSEIIGPAIKKELKSRDDKIEALEKRLNEKVSEVDNLKMQIDEIEQYSRKYCINVKGVPETPREDPIEIIMNIANGIGVTLQASDIDVAHRIGRSERTAGGGKTRDLCVKFRSYQKRSEVWQSRKALRSWQQPGTRMTRARSASQADKVPDVFMYENLTRHRQRVMYVARELKRANKLWAVWSDGGVMKVKKTQTSGTVIIKTEADVQKIAGQSKPSQSSSASDRPGSADGLFPPRHGEEGTGGAAGAGTSAGGGAAGGASTTSDGDGSK